MVGMLRAAAALVAPFLLSACLVTPGKFDASLDIRADRSFRFAYKGEIIASQAGEETGDPPAELQNEESAYQNVLLWQEGGGTPTEGFRDKDDQGDTRRMEMIAAALAKEKGFRSARYLGNRTFAIDYAIAGRLDHAFLFPFNIDAQIVLPFVAVELRDEDRVRVKAPGFANGFDRSQGPAMGGGVGDDAAKALDGTFTLTTDAEIVSQNQEDGAQNTPQGKRIVWKVTPMTEDAPAATLRLRP